MASSAPRPDEEGGRKREGFLLKGYGMGDLNISASSELLELGLRIALWTWGRGRFLASWNKLWSRLKGGREKGGRLFCLGYGENRFRDEWPNHSRYFGAVRRKVFEEGT